MPWGQHGCAPTRETANRHQLTIPRSFLSFLLWALLLLPRRAMRHEKGVHMDEKRAARRRLQLRRAYLSTARDMDIVANFERTSTLAAVIIGLAFGLMFFAGLI